MMVVGMPGLTEAQNRSLFSLWCLMAAPLMAGNDLRGMTKETVACLTNLEAIAVDQDPLGVQGHVVWNDGNVSLWAGKPLFDGSQAVLVFNQSRHAVDKRVAWTEIGQDVADRLFVRNVWTHVTSGPLEGGVSVNVAPDDAALLRVAKSADFPLPPILVADTYLLSFRAGAAGPKTLRGTVTITDKGSGDLPLWTVRGPLPEWLSVEVVKQARQQTFVNTVSTAGLKKGTYHALVRADNVEPRSGKPLTALYYDIDLVVLGDVPRGDGQDPR